MIFRYKSDPNNRYVETQAPAHIEAEIYIRLAVIGFEAIIDFYRTLKADELPHDIKDFKFPEHLKQSPLYSILANKLSQYKLSDEDKIFEFLLAYSIQSMLAWHKGDQIKCIIAYDKDDRILGYGQMQSLNLELDGQQLPIQFFCSGATDKAAAPSVMQQLFYSFVLMQDPQTHFYVDTRTFNLRTRGFLQLQHFEQCSDQIVKALGKNPANDYVAYSKTSTSEEINLIKQQLVDSLSEIFAASPNYLNARSIHMDLDVASNPDKNAEKIKASVRPN